MKKRTAKVLLGMTALLMPWDIHFLGNGIGWGFTFSFGEYNNTFIGTHTSLVTSMLGVPFDGSKKAAVYMWTLAFLLALIAVLYLVGARIVEKYFDEGASETLLEYEDVVVGILFLSSGLLFVVSRFFVYNLDSSSPDYLSIPFGALYAVLVGGIFVLSFAGGELSSNYSRAGVVIAVLVLVVAPVSGAVQIADSSGDQAWAQERVVYDSENDRIHVEWSNGARLVNGTFATSNKYTKDVRINVSIVILDDGDGESNSTKVFLGEGGEMVISDSGVRTRGDTEVVGGQGRVTDGDRVGVAVSVETEDGQPISLRAYRDRL